MFEKVNEKNNKTRPAAHDRTIHVDEDRVTTGIAMPVGIRPDPLTVRSPGSAQVTWSIESCDGGMIHADAAAEDGTVLKGNIRNGAMNLCVEKTAKEGREARLLNMYRKSIKLQRISPGYLRSDV